MSNRKEKIKEEFTSTISGSLEVEDQKNGYYIKIGEEKESGNNLNLYVGFSSPEFENYYEFLYGLIVTNKQLQTRSEILTNKKESNKYIPSDLVNRGVLFPIVEEYTSKLLDRLQPEKVLMRTDDKLTDNFLKRLYIIIDIFLNKGYMKEEEKDLYGSKTIKLSKENKLNEEKKETFEEFLSHYPPLEERNKRFSEQLNEELRTTPNLRNSFNFRSQVNNIKVLTESVKEKRTTPNKMVYHKSNIANRDSISWNGLYPSVEDCYKTSVENEFKCIPATFVINSDNKEELIKNETDNDVWEIDTEIAGVTWFVDDKTKELKHIITFEKIPKEALKIIKEV
jgi:hypothetical protein